MMPVSDASLRLAQRSRGLIALVLAFAVGGLGVGCSATGGDDDFVIPGSTTTPSSCPQAAVPPGGTEPAFPLRVASGQRYLVDDNGRPFLLQGDAPWSLIAQLERSDVERYLDARQAQGFNTLLVNLLEHSFATKAPANIYGEEPFTTPGDYSTPNEAYFSHAEWVLQQAGARGFVVLLTPSYMGYQGSEQGWYSEMKENGPEKLREYGRYLGRRFSALSNVIWVQAGDYDPPESELVDALADGLRSELPTALQTAHTAPNNTASARWGDRSWLALDNLYPTTEAYKDSLDLFLTSSRPFFLIESIYENEHGATTQLLRAQAYFTFLSGGMGHVFGNNPMWHFDGPGLYEAPDTWQRSLDSPGARSMQHLRRLLDGHAWWLLRPDVDQAFLADGIGEGAERATASVACDQSFGLIYVPRPKQLVVQPPRRGEPALLRWFDPTSGAFTVAHPELLEDGSLLVPPRSEANAAGDSDWVLVVEASS